MRSSRGGPVAPVAVGRSVIGGTAVGRGAEGGGAVGGGAVVVGAVAEVSASRQATPSTAISANMPAARAARTTRRARSAPATGRATARDGEGEAERGTDGPYRARAVVGCA